MEKGSKPVITESQQLPDKDLCSCEVAKMAATHSRKHIQHSAHAQTTF